MIAKPPLVEMSPDLRMLTTMKVSAGTLCVTAPATVPQAKAPNRFSVHRFATIRRRRLASVFRFSVSSRMPTKKSPSPPSIPPTSSITAFAAPFEPGYRNSDEFPEPAGAFMQARSRKGA